MLPPPPAPPPTRRPSGPNDDGIMDDVRWRLNMLVLVVCMYVWNNPPATATTTRTTTCLQEPVLFCCGVGQISQARQNGPMTKEKMARQNRNICRYDVSSFQMYRTYIDSYILVPRAPLTTHDSRDSSIARKQNSTHYSKLIRPGRTT